ncbi:MAG TPA: 16S rRNA (cytidine(1402)-2'-O)-methyltransferase [Dongiaceae bacterium]
MKGSHSGQRSKPRPGGGGQESGNQPQPPQSDTPSGTPIEDDGGDDSIVTAAIEAVHPRLAGHGCLALVATPIGNLGDISPRALDWLRRADFIACEDSRVSGRLLQHYGIAKKLMAYHDHNADEVRPILMEHLQGGARIALISDAGTPLISDPGYKLVRAAAEAGIKVTALPGPSAPVMALILSGLPTDRFLFAGFLPVKSAARRQVAAELAAVPASLIFFETAPRLAESLADLAAVLGNRPAAVARELTKLYEEVRRGALDDLAAHYRDQGPPRGEIVLVIAPPSAETTIAFDLDAALAEALGRMSVKDAAASVAAASGLKRRVVYARALELARQADSERDSG